MFFIFMWDILAHFTLTSTLLGFDVLFLPLPRKWPSLLFLIKSSLPELLYVAAHRAAASECVMENCIWLRVPRHQYLLSLETCCLWQCFFITLHAGCRSLVHLLFLIYSAPLPAALSMLLLSVPGHLGNFPGPSCPAVQRLGSWPHAPSHLLLICCNDYQYRSLPTALTAWMCCNWVLPYPLQRYATWIIYFWLRVPR